MRNVIRQKREDEKEWVKELRTVKNIGHYNECWHCDKCHILYEREDIIMYWVKKDDWQVHCPKCDRNLAGGSEKYFEENYILKV